MKRLSTTQKKQPERAQFWRAPDLPGIEILHAHYFTHSFARHFHSGFVISIIEGGAGAFWYKGCVYPSQPGCLGLLNPDEPHTGQVLSEQGWKYRALYIAPEILDQVAQDIADKPWKTTWFPEPIVFDPRIAQLMRELHQLLRTPHARIECEALLLSVLIQLLKRHAGDPLEGKSHKPLHWAVKQVRQYIEAHYADNLSLQQLASLVNLNPFHLTDVFRQGVGLPPHAYLNQVRVDRARQLILAGEPLAQVAYETGFVDQSHLTRRFKQIVGCTPGQVLK